MIDVDIVKEYGRLEKEYGLYDRDDIFLKLIELHIEPLKDSLSKRKYLILVGEVHTIVTDHVRSTYE